MEFPYEISRSVSEGYKVWLLCGAMGLVALWRWVPRRLAVGLLAVLAVVATLNYGRFGTKTLTERVDAYDLVHYYLNAKYFDELGYYDLYPAAILADHANRGPRFQEGNRYMAQSAAGHRMRPIEHALERGREVRESRFTPDRWEAFEHDLLYLQRETGGFTDKLWRQMIQDHGYNGTPVWTVVARPLARAVPVESVKLLGYIDLVLLLAGAGAIGWAYGGAAALWTWFFLMVSYSLRWPTVSWAFLRYDYVVALMAGLALVKKGRPFWAGVATAWSATMRLFPAVWLFGPGAKGVFGLVERKVHKGLLVLAGGFLLGVAALQGGAVAVLGPEPVSVHFENMLDHNSAEQLSSRRIGLALALPFRGELNPKYIEDSRKEAIAAQKPLRFALAGLVMLALGWGLRRARDDEAYAFGFIPFFLLTTASYYYYVTRVTMVSMHAGELDKPRNQAGLLVLLGVELFSNWSETAYPGHRVFQVGWQAWLLTGYTLLMTGWFLWEARQKGRVAQAPAALPEVRAQAG